MSQTSILYANGESNQVLNQTSLGVLPAILEVGPGKSMQQEVDVFNITDKAIPVRAVIEGFSLEDKSDIPNDKIEMYDASEWIKLSEEDTNFILNPREIKNIKIDVVVPEGSSPGGHYATIYFQPLTPETELSTDTTNVYIRMGVLVLIQNPGDIIENLEVSDLKTNFISNDSELEITTKVLNTGNIHLFPRGKINVYDDLRNELIGSVDIGGLTLPGLEKEFSVTFDTKLSLGKVSAEVEWLYGVDNITTKSEKVSVLIFSYAGILFLILIIIFAIIFRKRLIKAAKVFISYRPTYSGTVARLKSLGPFRPFGPFRSSGPIRSLMSKKPLSVEQKPEITIEKVKESKQAMTDIPNSVPVTPENVYSDDTYNPLPPPIELIDPSEAVKKSDAKSKPND